MASVKLDAADRGETLVAQTQKLTLLETLLVSAIDKHMSAHGASKTIYTCDCALSALAMLADLYQIRGQMSQVEATNVRALDITQDLLRLEENQGGVRSHSTSHDDLVRRATKVPRQQSGRRCRSSQTKPSGHPKRAKS